MMTTAEEIATSRANEIVKTMLGLNVPFGSDFVALVLQGENIRIVREDEYESILNSPYGSVFADALSMNVNSIRCVVSKKMSKGYALRAVELRALVKGGQA